MSAIDRLAALQQASHAIEPTPWSWSDGDKECGDIVYRDDDRRPSFMDVITRDGGHYGPSPETGDYLIDLVRLAPRLITIVKEAQIQTAGLKTRLALALAALEEP